MSNCAAGLRTSRSTLNSSGEPAQPRLLSHARRLCFGWRPPDAAQICRSFSDWPRSDRIYPTSNHGTVGCVCLRVPIGLRRLRAANIAGCVFRDDLWCRQKLSAWHPALIPVV